MKAEFLCAGIVDNGLGGFTWRASREVGIERFVGRAEGFKESTGGADNGIELGPF